MSLRYTHGFEAAGLKHLKNSITTHQPVLWEACCASVSEKKTDIIILEFGGGDGSTPIVNYFSTINNVKCITIESDNKWMQKIKSRYKSESHIFYKAEDNTSSSTSTSSSWEKTINDIHSVFPKPTLTFIDQGNWWARQITLEKFVDSSFVIVHDSDYLIKHFGTDYNTLYKYTRKYMPEKPYPFHTGPPTVLLSNFYDITDWDINYSKY